MRETEWWLKDSVPTLSSQLKPVDDSDDRSLGTAAIGMYADGADGDGLTAFRRAEKRYKLHREQIVRTQANGRRKGGKLVTRPVNLADVLDTVDFARLATLGPASRVSTLASTSSPAGARTTYAIDGHPGAVFVPGALSPEEQRAWVATAVTESCEPPARTNHDAAYGAVSSLWREAHSRPARYLNIPDVDEDAADDSNVGKNGGWAHLSPEPTGGDPLCTLAATRLLLKLRWATIGPPYDWTSRQYDRDAACVPVPKRVVDTCAQLAAAAGHRDFERGALAGLINYYRAGDALAGHVDDAERDMSAPIVSVSLGCPCVFLLGGTDRDVTPTAVLMRSGDAVVLSGASRSCYHGLPRIFTAEEGCLDGAGDALGCPEYLGNPEAWREEPDVARYIANGRVNVSVRVVD